MFPCEGRGPGRLRKEPSSQRWIKIAPIRVQPFDLAQLPKSLPFLHLQLTQPRLFQVVEGGIPDEQLAFVLASEARDKSVAMLPNAFYEV